MNIIANNIASKLSVAFVAIAMVLTFAAPAKAQTTEELQQMINDLLAQVAALQSQVGGDSEMSSSSVCPYTWTRSLSVGDSGADVMKLQQFLNANASTRVAASGVGSVGAETEYFGGLTGAAVAKFQEMHRTDILSPLGLVNSTTYFGPSTMAKANALCATSMPNDSDDDDDDNGDTSGSVDLDGLAALGDTDLKDGDDTEIEEGQNDAPVAEFEVEFNNGDARITLIDLDFSATGEDPWDTFESISLWVDGDMVAEKDADDEDDWLNDEQTLRFAGLDIVSMEDDETVITIGVSVQNSIDDLPTNWDVDVTNMRYIDGDGVNTTEDPSVTPTDFDVQEAGGDDELNIRSSSDDPDSTTFAVEDNTNSDWHTVFAFDLDTDDSVNDIEVETAVVSVQTGTENYEDVVNDARLVIDGEEFDDFTVSGEGTTYATLTFDIDKDLEIDAGDRVLAELQLEFKKLDGTNYNQGETVQATTTEIGWEAEGADDLTVGTQLDGSATGDVHTLRTEGIIVEAGDHSTDSSGQDDTTGIFEIEFEVTAFEEDMYIAENATSTNDDADGGVYYTVEGDDATESGTLISTADEGPTAGVFVVREGETETFTLRVTVTANTAGDFRVLLNDIWFTEDDDGVTGVQTDPATPATDYRTGFQNIN